jgi:hypothetical protein
MLSLPVDQFHRAGNEGDNAAGSRAPHVAGIGAHQPEFSRSAHPGAAGIPWPQEHPAHGALHRAVADAVQGLLALIRESVCADCDLCRDGRNRRRSY